MEVMRCQLLTALLDRLGDDMVKPNGPFVKSKRLPNTLSVGLKNIKSISLLQRIKLLVACSSGSACHSLVSGDTHSKISSVLLAMNMHLIQ